MTRTLSLCLFMLAAPLALTHAGKIESAPPDSTSTPVASKKLPSKLVPTPTPAPAAATTDDHPKRTPDEIVSAFFETLKSDRVDAAYDALDADFSMVDAGNQSKSMRAQTQKALDAYGPVIGYELVLDEKLGTYLLRRTYVLAGQQLPLRWKFYFYKTSDRWKLIDLRIDDAIADWFNDAKKAP